MSNDVCEMFQTELDFKFKATIYNNFQTALKEFELFKKKNNDFLNYDNGRGLSGYLLTFAIRRQLYHAAYTPTSIYRARIEEVNKFKYPVLMLEKDDFVLNVAKTDRPNKLPNYSKYRSELALGNKEFDNQLCFNFDGESNSITNNVKKYAIISYNYFNGVLQHLSLIVPDYKYKSIQLVDNILNYVKSFEGYKQNDYEEEQVIVLRKELENEFEEQLVRLK